MKVHKITNLDESKGRKVVHVPGNHLIEIPAQLYGDTHASLQPPEIGRRTHQAGWDEMARIAWDAARSHEFNPNSLQVSLAEIARRSYGHVSTINPALEEGWRRAVRHAAADERITHEEEFRLRRFRDRLGLNRSSAHASATAQPNLTSRQRLTGLTQAAAAATVEDGERLLKKLSKALRKAGLG